MDNGKCTAFKYGFGRSKKRNKVKLTRRRRILRWTGILLALFWMILIFRFSAENGQQSGALSDSVLQTAVDLFDRITGQDLNGAMTPKLTQILGFCVRKAAHMTVYCMLGISVMLTMFTFPPAIWKKAGLTLLICAAYAGSDEFHQSFVAGRGPSLQDVCIDSLGAAAGILTALLAYCVFDTVRRRCCTKGSCET